MGIGFLNTAVDFAVLNLFVSLLGIYRGVELGFLNVISFSIAVLHSFFWNKYWTFASSDDRAILQNLGKFVAAAVLGIALLGAVVWGSKQEFGPVYYFVALLVLAVGEVVLWKTFRLVLAGQAPGAPKELLLFVVVSIVGTLINSALVAVVTGKIEPQFGLNKELWLNVVKAAATAVSLIWNFLGYKIFVFKR